MENITVFIRCNANKRDFSCPASIILGDLLSQISERDPEFLTPGLNYIAVKGNSEAALNLAATLEANGIQDNDVIDVSAPGKAG